MADILSEELGKYGLEKDKFLSLLNECDGLIAGSFPLYIYLKERGKARYESNDIDIFIDGYKPYRKICNELMYTYGYKIFRDDNKSYNYMDVSEMFGFRKDEKKIQVILTKCNPKHYMRTFDFTCCQTFVDNELGKVFTLDDMTSDFKTTITCDGTENVWHWTNFSKRFRKYLKRGFSFFLEGTDVTALLLKSKGRELESLKEIVEQIEDIIKGPDHTKFPYIPRVPEIESDSD